MLVETVGDYIVRKVSSIKGMDGYHYHRYILIEHLHKKTVFVYTDCRYQHPEMPTLYYVHNLNISTITLPQNVINTVKKIIKQINDIHYENSINAR